MAMQFTYFRCGRCVFLLILLIHKRLKYYGRSADGQRYFLKQLTCRLYRFLDVLFAVSSAECTHKVSGLDGVKWLNILDGRIFGSKRSTSQQRRCRLLRRVVHSKYILESFFRIDRNSRLCRHRWEQSRLLRPRRALWRRGSPFLAQ